MLAGILKENKVSSDGVNFDKGIRTALAFVTLRDDGEREFMFYRNPSADMLLKPEELNLDLIRSVFMSLMWRKMEGKRLLLDALVTITVTGSCDTKVKKAMQSENDSKNGEDSNEDAMVFEAERQIPMSIAAPDTANAVALSNGKRGKEA